MKKHFTVTVLSIAVIAVIMLLMRRCSIDNVAPPVRRSPTNTPTMPNIDAQQPIPESTSRAPQESPGYKFTPDEQRRIEETVAVFYGKVIDQFGSPVPEALIHYAPSYDLREDGLHQSWDTRTGSDGTFSIQKTNAPGLRIGVEPPTGYYGTDQDHGRFNFADPPASVPPKHRVAMEAAHVADQRTPVIFKLKKMGLTEPMIHRTKSVVLAAEQEFFVGTDTGHVLRVKYWLDPTLKRTDALTEQPIYDWGMEFSVPGGGLVERTNPTSTDSDSFNAPTEGYQERVRLEYVSDIDARQYRSEINGQYFVRFSDGKHARVELRLRSSPKRPFGTVESWFNPSGNRATEFDPAKEVKASPAR